MKMFSILIFFSPLFSFGQDRNFHQTIKDAIANKSGHEVCVENVLPDKETALAVAEQILFKVYGKDQILGERPYHAKLIDDYWVLSGTLPKNMLGGTFLIILSAKDGRVIKLIHYK